MLAPEMYDLVHSPVAYCVGVRQCRLHLHLSRPAELPLLCAQVPSMDNITEGFAGELDHVHTLLVEEDTCRSPATDQLPSLDCGSSDDGGEDVLHGRVRSRDRGRIAQQPEARACVRLSKHAR